MLDKLKFDKRHTEGVESTLPWDGLRTWDGCVNGCHVSGRPPDQCRPGING